MNGLYVYDTKRQIGYFGRFRWLNLVFHSNKVICELFVPFSDGPANYWDDNLGKDGFPPTSSYWCHREKFDRAGWSRVTAAVVGRHSDTGGIAQFWPDYRANTEQQVPAGLEKAEFGRWQRWLPRGERDGLLRGLWATWPWTMAPRTWPSSSATDICCCNSHTHSLVKMVSIRKWMKINSKIEYLCASLTCNIFQTVNWWLTFSYENSGHLVVLEIFRIVN